MPKLTRKKIIWAIDPYEDAKIQKPASAFAKYLSTYNDLEVVYVHGRSGFPFEKEKEVIRSGLASVEKQIKKILKEFGFKQSIKLEILVHGSEYVRGADAKVLLNYAKKNKADAILVSTNARAGMARFLVGSFSESLILKSDIPVFVINSSVKISSKAGTILYPTDFSSLSWSTYKRIVDFAKISNADIKIFHQYEGELQSIPSGVTYFRDHKWIDGKQLLDVDLQKIIVKLNKWIKWTKEQNVKCDFVLKFGVRNIEEAAIEIAKKDKVWMIAMASMAGPVAANFIGSNARWMVRLAHCPVLVQHVKEKHIRKFY